MNTFQPLFDRQQDYFRTGATHPVEWRLDQLDRLSRLVTENRAAFNEALAADFKTVRFEQDMEFGGALGSILDAQANVAAWMRPESVELPPAARAAGQSASVRRTPFGVTLLIAPFNAPVALLIDPLVAILAAGNTAIIKPSEAAPSVAALFLRLFPVYFDPEVVTVVTGGREEVTELLALPFDIVFFTGSTAVGKVVMRAAAENLTPLVLELGGQNPAVVDETANVVEAARELVWGASAFGGQWCVSPGYVYVHETVVDKFLAAAKAAVEEFWGADPAASPDLSRIISTQDTKRLADFIDPVKVVVGGAHDVESRYVSPTVLYPVTWDDAVMQAEIFGPILPVMVYSDISEVVVAVTRRPKPLATYLFSRDAHRIETLVEALPFGGGSVNQTMLQVMFPALPFGGVGASGMGRYYGKAGFDSLSQSKSIVYSDPDVAVEELLPPYADGDAERFAALLGL